MRKKEEKRNEEIAMMNGRKSVKEHLSAFGGKVAHKRYIVTEGGHPAILSENRHLKRLCGESGGYCLDNAVLAD